MRLPAHLLQKLRVGLGAGTVLLAGCDLVDEVKGAIEGGSDDVEIAAVDTPLPATDAPAAKPEADAEKASRGLAGKVAEALDEAKPEPLVSLPVAPEPEPEGVVPREEAEDVTAFVPFGEAAAKVPPRLEPRPKPRPEAPIALAPTPDEPCDPEVTSPVLSRPLPDRDPCPACGRG